MVKKNKIKLRRKRRVRKKLLLKRLAKENRKRYYECLNCGTLHYKVTETMIKSLAEIEDRNLECCCKCGKSDNFSEVNQGYIDEFGVGKVEPLLI